MLDGLVKEPKKYVCMYVYLSTWVILEIKGIDVCLYAYLYVSIYQLVSFRK